MTELNWYDPQQKNYTLRDTILGTQANEVNCCGDMDSSDGGGVDGSNSDDDNDGSGVTNGKNDGGSGGNTVIAVSQW